MKSTNDDKEPTTMPARIDSIDISPDWIKKVPITIIQPFTATKNSPKPESTIFVE